MDSSISRRKSRVVKIGNVSIGGDNPVAIQSMTNVPANDFLNTFKQAAALQSAGCEILRIAVPDIDTARVFDYLKSNGIKIPLVADIHFDYKIALASVECGADKIRINPGNIGSKDRIKAVADACRKANVPIRVGVNSGSLDKEILKAHGHVNAEGIAESALENIKALEEFDFDNIVVAVKSSDVPTMIEANRIISDKCDYPIHLGVTEAGGYQRGIIKSSVGIGTLLSCGIGDTVRVSLTDDPIKEVGAAKQILDYCGLRDFGGVEVVSCPTCGRTCVDLIGLVEEFEKRYPKEITNKNRLKVAIMGCAVNGPGEAKEADIGIAGGIGNVLLFKKGEIIRKIDEKEAITQLIKEINEME